MYRFLFWNAEAAWQPRSVRAAYERFRPAMRATGSAPRASGQTDRHRAGVKADLSHE
jgi:hypothetical protein